MLAVRELSLLQRCAYKTTQVAEQNAAVAKSAPHSDTEICVCVIRTNNSRTTFQQIQSVARVSRRPLSPLLQTDTPDQ